MTHSVPIFFIAAALAALQPAIGAENQEWQPSTLSDETLGKVREAVKNYQQCVNDETRAHLKDAMDTRKVADNILKACEAKLAAVKPAFDAEKVPGSVSERYMRSKRSLAAQQILRVVMAAQAARSTDGTH